MKFIWEALIVIIAGYILIRIAGKKAVAEMTGLELITLLSVASIMGHAISETEWWKTVIVMSAFVVVLIGIQFLCLKFDFAEKLFIGKATPVIVDGKIVDKNLKKLRMTVDQLEARLREKGISSIADIKMGTIEINGELGYELMPHAKPLTAGELKKIIKGLENPSTQQLTENILNEVLMEGHIKKIPRELD
jgi:uncharacterized membrane protein YcaP (DUF421 family)